ncbi:MAG: hypothetical protein PVJ64_17305 [Gemmatimonadales bacterium]|jgi:hypothetical protein
MRKLALIPLLALALTACQENMTQPGDGRADSTVPLGATDGDPELMLLGTTRPCCRSSPETFSMLVEIDPATGATKREIGQIGYAVNGLEQDPTDGTLYGSTAWWDPNHHGLIEIDPTTGAGTPIGEPGWGLEGTENSVNNITMNSRGEMFGWWEPTEEDLVFIDKSRAIATRVGDASIGTLTLGLDFDDSDVLYLVDDFDGRVHTVDPGSGATSFVQKIQRMAHHGDFHPSSNRYYGISGYRFSEPLALVIADLSTFTVEDELENLAENIHTLTFYRPGLVIDVTLDVAVDIKPGSCRNPVNVKAKGVLPAAILGDEEFDVSQVDPASVQLEGVAPLRWSREDVATPYDGTPEGADDCTDRGPDGWDDLTLKFENQEIIAALGDVEDGDVRVLTLTGNLAEEHGGSPIEGQDVVVILKKGKGGRR